MSPLSKELHNRLVRRLAPGDDGLWSGRRETTHLAEDVVFRADDSRSKVGESAAGLLRVKHGKQEARR